MNAYVKVREIGKKSWLFLCKDGVSRLKIHAAVFTVESAAELIMENSSDNPEWEFKSVVINP